MSRATWRRWRWVRVLASITWLGFILAVVLLELSMSPASADNCSVFSDCFGQSEAASEAALGLTFLAALSLVIDFIPIVGDVKGLVELKTGRDLLTGQELEPWERALGLVGLIPGGDLLRLAKLGDLAGGVASGARAADGLGDVGSGVGGLGRVDAPSPGVGRGSSPDSKVPSPRTDVRATSDLPPLRSPDNTPLTGRKGGEISSPPRGGESGRGSGDGGGRAPDSGARESSRKPTETGDTVEPGSHRSDSDGLVEEYLDSDATRGTRTRLSEQIGENGGADYIESVVDRDLDFLRPVTDADVADLVARFEAGQAWDSVVAFNGRNATNLLHYDGEVLHIVEAKGGASSYGDRLPVLEFDGARISQIDPDYPRHIAELMKNSKLSDGRNGIGELILDAYDQDAVSYVGVRTDGHNLGQPIRTILDRVFKTSEF